MEEKDDKKEKKDNLAGVILFETLSAQGDASVTDIAEIMSELSPNACLVYTDDQLQIFDPGYHSGLEELDQQQKPLDNAERTVQESSFTGTGGDYNVSDMELNNAVNEVMAG